MSALADMALAELAAQVKSGSITLEAVQLEWARRRAAGLDPFTNAPPAPATASEQHIPAIACPHCGALSRAAIDPGEVAR